MNSDILSTLQVMEIRPKMFLRKESLALLEAYIEGFEMCRRANKLMLPKDRPNWEEFVDWLRAKYEVSDQTGWASALREAYEEQNEEQLFQNFFREIEAFLQEE